VGFKEDEMAAATTLIEGDYKLVEQ